MRGIILLEGADAAGKTTLARYLVEVHGARYLHNGIHRDIWRWHAGALRRAFNLSRDNLVVIDRLWLSELAYGAVFRGGPAYDVAARCLDRLLRRFAAITVLCAPADQQRQIARWEAGRAAGKTEHFDRVREVIALYADLRDGNVAHPDDGYLDQLIRFGDFAARDDVMIYDLDEHGLRVFADRVTTRLERVRDSAVCLDPTRWNLTGRVDSSSPGILLVGEASSPTITRRAHTIPAPPFTAPDAPVSATTWLNEALHRLAIREDRIVITNALDRDDHLPELLTLADGSPAYRVIALGKVAAERLRRLNCREFAEVPHPQHHRRFHHGDGPAGYAEMLREAIR